MTKQIEHEFLLLVNQALQMYNVMIVSRNNKLYFTSKNVVHDGNLIRHPHDIDIAIEDNLFPKVWC